MGIKHRVERLSKGFKPGDLCTIVNDKEDGNDPEVGPVNDPCGEENDCIYRVKAGTPVVVVSDCLAFRHDDNFDDDVLIVVPVYGLVWIREFMLRREVVAVSDSIRTYGYP